MTILEHMKRTFSVGFLFSELRISLLFWQRKNVLD